MNGRTALVRRLVILGILSLVLLAGCGGSTAPAANNQPPPPSPATNHQFVSTGNLIQNQLLHSTTLLPDGRVLVACGFNGAVATGEVELFDPVSGTFQSFSTKPRMFCTVTLLRNRKVLVAGGETANNSQTAANTAELFDPATGLFSRQATWQLRVLATPQHCSQTAES